MPVAWIVRYEDLIPAMTNHPKDRHVLAAAVRAGAKVIVTYNIKDYPRSSLTPYYCLRTHLNDSRIAGRR
jgi:hypothetical protein